MNGFLVIIAHLKFNFAARCVCNIKALLNTFLQVYCSSIYIYRHYDIIVFLQYTLWN